MRAIGFDLDGTLVDSRRDIATSANLALDRLGLPRRSLEEVESFVGRGARNLVARCVAPRDELTDAGLAAFLELYAGHLLDTTVAYPQAVAALPRLVRAGRLVVVTNKPGALARRVCDSLFPGTFEVVLGGDEGPRKPDPALLRAALGRVGATVAEAVFVGDSGIDRETAAAAGVPFVGVAWGYGSGALAEPVARTAGELVDLVVRQLPPAAAGGAAG